MDRDEQNILDEFSFEEENIKYAKWLSWALLLDALLIWILLYTAKDLPYDANYSNLMISMLISVFSCLGLLIISIWNSNLLRINLISVALYLLSSSPISLVAVLLNYKSVFGKALELG